jgi:hypothetical protein
LRGIVETIPGIAENNPNVVFPGGLSLALAARVLIGVMCPAALLLARLLTGILGLLAWALGRLLLARLLLVLIGHYSISFVEPFNAQTTSGCAVRFGSGVIIARPLRAATVTRERRRNILQCGKAGRAGRSEKQHVQATLAAPPPVAAPHPRC